MINDVVLEGIIVHAWKFAVDLLFRLACYRDPDLPTKLLNDTRGFPIDREEHLGTFYWKKRAGIDFWCLFVNDFSQE